MHHHPPSRHPAPPTAASARNAPARRLTRDHLLFGLAFAGFLAAVLALAGAF